MIKEQHQIVIKKRCTNKLKYQKPQKEPLPRKSFLQRQNKDRFRSKIGFADMNLDRLNTDFAGYFKSQNLDLLDPFDDDDEIMGNTEFKEKEGTDGTEQEESGSINSREVLNDLIVKKIKSEDKLHLEDI